MKTHSLYMYPKFNFSTIKNIIKKLNIMIILKNTKIYTKL